MQFEGVLLLSDMDNTLLDTNKNISEENQQAIREFQAGGGKFAIVTGRIPSSVYQYHDAISFETPIVSHNGGAIYDFKTESYLWQTCIDRETVYPLMDKIKAWFSDVAFELYVSSEKTVYTTYDNAPLRWHVNFEHFITQNEDYHHLALPLIKVIAIAEPETIECIFSYLETLPEYKEFSL